MTIDEIEYIQFTDVLKTPNELLLNQEPPTHLLYLKVLSSPK